MRLTPQQVESTVQLERGTFRAMRTSVQIEYVAARVYGWSFAPHLPRAMPNNVRLRLSRELLRVLHHHGHSFNQEPNRQQEHIQRYLVACREGDTGTPRDEHVRPYADCLRALCQPAALAQVDFGGGPPLLAERHAQIDWHRVSGFLLRRARKQVSSALTLADQHEDLFDLLDRAIGSVRTLVARMQQDTPPSGDRNTRVSLRQPDPAAGGGALALPAAWSLPAWRGLQQCIGARTRLHHDVQVVQETVAFVRQASAALREPWPWCSVELLETAIRLLPDLLAHAEQRIECFRELARRCSELQLHTMARSACNQAIDSFHALHGEVISDASDLSLESVAMRRQRTLRDPDDEVADQRRTLAALRGDIVLQHSRDHAHVDADLASQLEHATESILRMQQACMDLAAHPEDGILRKRLQLDTASNVIKLRHSHRILGRCGGARVPQTKTRPALTSQASHGAER